MINHKQHDYDNHKFKRLSKYHLMFMNGGVQVRWIFNQKIKQILSYALDFSSNSSMSFVCLRFDFNRFTFVLLLMLFTNNLYTYIFYFDTLPATFSTLL